MYIIYIPPPLPKQGWIFSRSKALGLEKFFHERTEVLENERNILLQLRIAKFFISSRAC